MSQRDAADANAVEELAMVFPNVDAAIIADVYGANGDIGSAAMALSEIAGVSSSSSAGGGGGGFAGLPAADREPQRRPATRMAAGGGAGGGRAPAGAPGAPSAEDDVAMAQLLETQLNLDAGGGAARSRGSQARGGGGGGAAAVAAPSAAAMQAAIWPGCEPLRFKKWVFNTMKQERGERPWELEGEITAVIHNKNFEEGGLRFVRRMREVEPDGSYLEYVAKFFKFEADKREWYFGEVEGQMEAEKFAQQFNQMKPPKKVGFVQPAVIECVQGPDPATGRAHKHAGRMCNIEPLMEGHYEKHNDNDGNIFMDKKVEFVRNTPQAFSHFTWEQSGNRLVVCDVQGVGDLYTDPQIHTTDGKGFGQGNMGRAGIDKYLQSHTCNDICRMMGLRPLRPGVSISSAAVSQEVKDYATYLGIQPSEPDLLWIASEGLVAPLPQGWTEHRTADANPYFHDSKSGKSSWQHPYDPYYRQLVTKTRAAAQIGATNMPGK